MEISEAPEVPGFVLGRLLGRGGSATVWLARENRTGRDFAVKCFHPVQDGPAGSGPATEDAVRREIRILSVLDHEHLIKAHDAVRLPGMPAGGTALVMDYAPGGSLAALVASRGKLSVGETVTVLTPIAHALGYLHSKGFTHSDVSPGNILFTGQGKPLLSDVGIARMLGDPGSAAPSGTPGFVDPSPVDAVRGLQPERDVYSAAALGWFCLTGQAPPRTSARPPLPLLVPDVPRELAAALEAGLKEDRRGRPTAAALATAIYRSASPRPLDLAASVHPTVIPELLTRRQVAATTRPRAAAEKCRAAGRWIVTAKWPGAPSPGLRLPFPQPVKERRPSGGGKHAGTAQAGAAQTVTALSGAALSSTVQPGAALSSTVQRGTVQPSTAKPLRPRSGRARAVRERRRPPSQLRVRRLRGVLASAALVGAAAAWWVAVAAGLPAGPAFPPASGITPESAITPEPVTEQESVITQEPGRERGIGTAAAGTTATQAAQADQTTQVVSGSGAGSGSAGGDSRTEVARHQARASDPSQAVQGLAALRDLAFSTGDLGLLDEVNAEGSPAAAADARTAGRLRSSGHVLAGFSSSLEDLHTEDGVTAARAVVRVRSSSSAYEERDAGGIVVGAGPAGTSRQLRLVLVAVDGTWRISEILPGG
ncbi:serine/threonine-protein kinase [Pseudarthrobacter sp. NPDC092184]|uniref:serine/threonine-protein kinase n=1 Tax=unclassified Pseudarthrobacter TaxID=2647000 RepID=UPI00382B6BFA